MKTVKGESLTIEDVCDVAYKNEEVKLPEDNQFWETMEKSRKFLEDYIATGVPTYGVTTDFGDSCHNQISVDKAGELQRVICTYHGIGLGPKFDHETARAVVLCRLNGNVKGGHSAIRPQLAKMMVTLLNKDIIPVIPQLGSVGASGDLTPLSYLGAVIMGQREVYYKGKIVPTMEAFKAEGIEPLPIEAKEGLAIMNANRFANGSAIFTQNGYYARQFELLSDGGMVGINVGIPVPSAYFPFSGNKDSFFGDQHVLGIDGVRFFTRAKTVTKHWYDENSRKKAMDTWEGTVERN